ncbi:MAG TPA: hypothetical protein VF789_01140 [Thermoanaerobaculia bacterium]
MNSFRKLVVVLALVTVAILTSSGAAFTAIGTTYYEGAAAAGVCACCPAGPPGSVFVGCYNTVNMPPNAVTCVYEDANGNVFAWVSCINKAPAVADTDAGSDF